VLHESSQFAGSMNATTSERFQHIFKGRTPILKLNKTRLVKPVARRMNTNGANESKNRSMLFSTNGTQKAASKLSSKHQNAEFSSKISPVEQIFKKTFFGSPKAPATAELVHDSRYRSAMYKALKARKNISKLLEPKQISQKNQKKSENYELNVSKNISIPIKWGSAEDDQSIALKDLREVMKNQKISQSRQRMNKTNSKSFHRRNRNLSLDFQKKCKNLLIKPCFLLIEDEKLPELCFNSSIQGSLNTSL